MKTAVRIIFILLFLTIYFSMHYYIYYRIKNDFKIQEKFLPLLRIIVIVIAQLFFVSEILKRMTHFDKLTYFGEIWFGIISLAITILLLKDVTLFAASFFKSGFISGNMVKINIASYSLLVFAVLLALWNGGRTPTVKEINIISKKLPEKYSGFTIVHLSDMHINNTTSLVKLQKIVTNVNQLNPDIIVITGDMIDAKFYDLQKECEVIKNLKAKYGIYTITGNHEFYTGVEYFIEFNKCLGFKLLNNENENINDAIQIAGIFDVSGKYYDKKYFPDLDKTFNGIEPSKYTIFLSHVPVNFKEAVDKGADLELSGHVHRGQFPPAFPIVYFMFKYAYGLYNYKDSFIYTTSGTLTWGPTMRLFSNNEIVKIKINSAK